MIAFSKKTGIHNFCIKKGFDLKIKREFPPPAMYKIKQTDIKQLFLPFLQYSQRRQIFYKYFTPFSFFIFYAKKIQILDYKSSGSEMHC